MDLLFVTLLVTGIGAAAVGLVFSILIRAVRAAQQNSQWWE